MLQKEIPLQVTEPLHEGKKLPELDRKLLVTILALIGVGIVLIYSADQAQGSLGHFNKQAVIAGVGLVLMILLMMLPPRIFYALSYVFYGLALGLLLMVTIFGVTGLGAKRWLDLGGFRFQPSEPAKIAFIILAARLLADTRSPNLGWKALGNVAIVAIPPFALTVLQPDLGTATVFPVISFVLLAWYGLSLYHFAIVFLPLVSLFFLFYPLLIIPIVIGSLVWLKKRGIRWIGLISLFACCIAAAFIAPTAWNQLEPYQKKRITSFLDPYSDPLGSGYQVIQSQVAIGSGGFAGTGYRKGTQTQLRFLPQQHTDFIFSLAGEEFGFIGTSVIIFLYFMLGWRGFMAATRVKNQFMSISAAGLTVLILYHAVVNIGMTLGNLPVTGLPLPFISYGGSFLLTCMCAMGIVISASIYRRGY